MDAGAGEGAMWRRSGLRQGQKGVDEDVWSGPQAEPQEFDEGWQRGDVLRGTHRGRGLL